MKFNAIHGTIILAIITFIIATIIFLYIEGMK